MPGHHTATPARAGKAIRLLTLASGLFVVVTAVLDRLHPSPGSEILNDAAVLLVMFMCGLSLYRAHKVGAIILWGCCAVTLIIQAMRLL